MDEIRFYRSAGVNGFLSNLYPCKIVVKLVEMPMEGVIKTMGWKESTMEFGSVEHAYQWMKPNKMEIADWIRKAPYPRLASIVGHSLLPYDIFNGWNEMKVDWMLQLLRIKFAIPHMRQKLLDTNNTMLVEDSKTDAFWGIGKKGNGINQLGILLMRVRDEIRKEE